MFVDIAQFFIRSFKTSSVRSKILITSLVLIFFRLIAHIPVAGIDREALANLFNGSPLLSLLDVFAGGTLANFSILGLGLNPYINASIILQLLGFVIPSLEKLQEEGEYGTEKITQYTRFLTVPLAATQAIGAYFLLKGSGIIKTLSPLGLIAFIVTMIAGTMIAVWLGELITEYGITNGVSFLIFAGIISRLPTLANQAFSSTQSSQLAIFGVVTLIIVALVVFINEAKRQVPVYYARRLRRENEGTNRVLNYIPLRLNQAGVIPIIFAVSLILVPSLAAQFAGSIGNSQISDIAFKISSFLAPRTVTYNVLYFALVVGFTYFYTNVVFNPEKISERLQKNGGFIPGVRPGSQTVKYLGFILSRITLAGAIFLGFIAVLPSVLESVMGVSNLVIGGTGVLIVVSVIIEAVRNLQAQLVVRKYERVLE